MEKIVNFFRALPWEKIWDAFKAAARNFVLAVLPILMAHFETLSWEGAGFVFLALVGLDKFLHQLWKGDESKPKGLVPF